ncbi:MAG: hypothetical protein SFV23_03835, partial [Planctomycetaceae bacterium]|nr:hypothetical protein [Planctomycetaceae bacterium]
WGKIVDYFWHLTLPLIAMAVGTFTTMAFLTKNSFLDEIRKGWRSARRIWATRKSIATQRA